MSLVPYTSAPSASSFFSRSEASTPDKSTIYYPCTKSNCSAPLPFPIDLPRNGHDTFCISCLTAQQHPLATNTFAQRKNSKAHLLELVKELLDGAGSTWTANGQRRSARLAALSNTMRYDPSDRSTRPSICMPSSLAVSRWPSTQSPYTDHGIILMNGRPSPLLARDTDVASGRTIPAHPTGEYIFNSPGNWQTYSPGFQIQLTTNDKVIMANADLAINRTGRRGQQLLSAGCGMRGVVRDGKGDLVMCGSDGTCTAACGVALWSGGGQQNVPV